jgi:type VI secretion system protein ImpA
MPSPSILDFNALIAPIPGANPAGNGSLPFELREKLEEGRKELNPEDYAPDDPKRPDKPKKADWAAIHRLAQDTLTKTSKDLLLAARMTEALTKLHGFAGLRDGLRLLRELVEKCWDRLNPPIEDGDLDVRAGPFYWLDDADRGALFPYTIRTAPLVSADGKQYGWHAWRQSQDGKGPVSREDIEKAILAAPLPQCENVAADVAQSLEELNKLAQVLAAKMGPAAPGLTGMRQAVQECQELIQQIVKRKRPAGTTAEGPGGKAEGGSAGTAKTGSTRAQLYHQLGQAANALRELEPHSPIPFLIQRAVELGAMPFPELIKELVRDAKIVGELNRELGIKETPSAPPKKPA